MKRLLLFSILIIFLLPSQLLGQASVNVNNLDPVYRDIDKLVGFGLVDKIIMGQRPFSRRQIADIAGQAMNNLPRLEDKLKDPNVSGKKKEQIKKRLAYIYPILARMKRRFNEELIQLGILQGKSKWYSVHFLDHAYFDSTAADSLPRNVPPNGLGDLDVLINPLLQNRQGRHVVDGSTTSLETVTWLRASDHFVLLARPRFQLAFGRDGMPNDNKVFVQELYGKFYVSNLEIEVGRDNIFYGQGKNTGIILSNNPRALDMAKISNDIPFFFPWVFKYLGAQKMSFFYSDLGPEQNFPHAYLVGYKWSMQPLSFFEIGGSMTVHSGGEGAPPASFLTRVGDIFPIAHIITGDQDEIGNKIGGLDFRFRVPPARGLEIYGEAIFDDVDFKRLKSMLWQESGYVFGVYLPRLFDSGELDLRLEYHHTGIRFYRHTQFTSGFSLNKFVLGDILGPDGNAGYLWVDWDVTRQDLITFHLAFENRSNDIYTSLSDPFRFVKLETLPKENRFRGVVSWQHRVKELPILLDVQLGVERVHDFQFISGNNRNNYMGRVGVQVEFDRWTRFPQTYQ